MKFILVGFISAYLALSALPVYAGSVSANLQWDANVEQDLAGYKVYRGQINCNQQGPLQPLTDLFGTQITVAAPATKYTDNSVPAVDGDVCYEITAYDTGGLQSGHSNRATKYINVNPPNVPTGLTVDVQATP